MTRQTRLTCTCAQVALELGGEPIASTECLCADCQRAGALLQTLPDASPVLDHQGGTRFVLYRKDRVDCVTGHEHLREHRLTRESDTRRVVAICCNTPMFLEFTKGHWLSIYGARWPEAELPALEVRTMTRDRPKGVELPDDVPNPEGYGFSFFARLIGAWAAMRFRTPKIEFVHGVLEAP